MENNKYLILTITLILLIGIVFLIFQTEFSKAYRIEEIKDGVINISIFGSIPLFLENQIESYPHIINVDVTFMRTYILINQTRIRNLPPNERLGTFLDFVEEYNLENYRREILMRRGYGMILNDKAGNSYECFIERVNQINKDIMVCTPN